jgi:hypothetical protein
LAHVVDHQINKFVAPSNIEIQFDATPAGGYNIGADACRLSYLNADVG